LAEVERVPQRSTQKIAEAVGLGSHETYRKANKKGRKKMLQQLLGQEPEQKDWGRHIEEARAKGLAGPW